MRLSYRSVHAEPIHVGAATLTPHSRVLSVGMPNGGVAWQFPTGVRVEQDGSSRWLPIVDVTFLAQCALFALTLLAVLKGRTS
jgi:hypothetical protein